MSRALILITFACCFAATALPQQLRLLSLPLDNYVDVSFADSLHGWIVGSKSLYRTTDGGASWNRDSISEKGSRFFSVYSSTSSCAWLAWLGNNQYSNVSRTINGGLEWQTMLSVPTGGISNVSYQIVRCADSLHAWAEGSASPVGGDTWVRHTMDGGQSEWSIPLRGYNQSDNSFSALALVSDSVVSTIFSQRFLYITSNAGTTWTKDTLLGRYHAIAMKRIDCIWVVGDTGRILKSNAGGTGYSFQPSGTTAQLLSISAPDTLNAWIAGKHGTLLQTTNGGLSWQRVPVPVLANLNSVCFVNKNLGWIVGDSGVVIQYKNGLLASAHNLTTEPHPFVLNHNYPNPFNPSTRISFSMKSEGFVRLEVYNVIGRLVDVLLQETKPAGDHFVAWTPNRLSSGTYFLKLMVGSEVRSEKVLLIR